MRKKHILLFLLCLCTISISAQSLEEAKKLFKQEKYEKAKPTFKRYAKENPSNASYNHWYGACCYETGEKELAEKHLLIGAKKKVQESFHYLGKLYDEEYRFDEALENYETYITLLEKDKKPTEKYQAIIEKLRISARMLKGVEEVNIIDSIVVDKNDFLSAYKISEESGKLFTYNDYFEATGNNPGTVYQTERENKLYYANKGKNKNLQIYTKNKMNDSWGEAIVLPDAINSNANENYPFVLTDGVTIYYASEGKGSIGGYDIFVTRYNTNTETYLTPDNVGMPFNSPFNDYMYVIDEYNNLGWFASDRFQPENKVCIYIFIPTTSKQIYNYETTDPAIIRKAAMIQSLKASWKDKTAVKDALKRLEEVSNHQPIEKKVNEFEFVIDDNITYTSFEDFTSPKAKPLFKQWQQAKKDYEKLAQKLEEMRLKYTLTPKEARKSMSAGILDLEKRVEQMDSELDKLETSVRNEEKKFMSK